MFAAVIRCYDLGRPITDPYSFRQTQTAWLIRHLSQSGVDFFSGYLPVLGAPWQLPFEFPVYQNVAAMVVWCGFNVEAAGRVVSILSCLISAYLLYSLLRARTDERLALVSTMVFLFVPYSVFWSSAILIDFLALTFSLGFLLGTSRFSEHGSLVSLVVTTVCAAVAGALKLPSLLFYGIPAAVLLGIRWRGMRDKGGGKLIVREMILLAFCALCCVLPFICWTRYADAIKESQEFTSFAVSSKLHEWYFGSFEQFFESGGVARVLSRMLENFGFLGAQIFFILGIGSLLLVRSVRVFSISLLLQLLFTIAVFLNLHLSHHYYQIAVLPAVSFFVAAGIILLFELLPRFKLCTVLIILLGLTLVRLSRIEQYLVSLYAAKSVPASYLTTREWGLYLKGKTTPPDLVAVVGLESWDPAILYAADRRGFMVREERASNWRRYITTERYSYVLFVRSAAASVPTDIDEVPLELVGVGPEYALMRLRYE